ncbi:hypothetical protein PpBr36_00186 [Pyricularia pennisetigena]|uniref:hypothetical protein n=1 Tax=Pyricularia pennisetigena TaxID=1578925 RepID=UPI00114FD0AA|nr:hypothetical protein PpBr36_00186 [Pyricularia pennisetigena]TLS29469.1 hypothetical protein PpBr36_00186 [Pyricularia pennisetigena]
MTRPMDHEPDVEILVHISAPSLAVDDAHYRELASAYLNFEEARITRLEHSPPAALTPPRIHLFGTLESPPLSFDDVLDNVGSPGVKPRQEIQHDGREKHSQVTTTESQQSWEAPPSTVGDSQPYNDITFERFCDPDRFIEYELEKLDHGMSVALDDTLPALGSGSNRRTQALGASMSPTRGSSRQSTSAQGRIIVGPSPRRRGASIEVPSSLPTAHRRSQRLASSHTSPAASSSSAGRVVSTSPDITSSPPIPRRLLRPAPRSSADVQASPSLRGDVIEVPSSPPTACPRHAKDVDVSFGSVITCSDRAESEPPPAKKTRRMPRKTPQAVGRSTSDIGQQLENHKATDEIPHAHLLDALEVFGPEPPVSIRHVTPDDLLTPQLRKLQSDLGKAKRYSARLQLLQDQMPDPFERGWWILDCSELGDRRLAAWEYLARYVHAGNAGWGVSLMRESAATHRIKLFCYGHLAGHMYLLLYMASERRIYDLDCTWTSARRGGLLFVPAIKGR